MKSRERTRRIREEQRLRNIEAEKPPAVPPGCTRHSFRCPMGKDTHVETPACCRHWILDILKNIGGLLDEIGATWWVDYGTLLGAVRHGGLIPWDKDTDLGILPEDRDALLAAFPRIISEFDYFPTYAKPNPKNRFRTGDRVKVRLSQRNKTNTDIFIWNDRPGGLLDRTNYIGSDRFKGRDFPRKWLFPLQRVDFDGVEVNLPAQAEKLVQWRYGNDWKTPQHDKHPPIPRKTWAEEHGER